MNPGRELDALVAEKVMGWTRTEHLGLKRTVWNIPAPSYIEWADDPPPFSTDIAAAWEVVERLRANYSFQISADSSSDWECYLENEDLDISHVSARSETAPHAICLAALKTVEKI